MSRGHVIWGQLQMRAWATGGDDPLRTGAPGSAHPAEMAGEDPVATWRAARATATNELLSWTRPTPRLDHHENSWDMHFHGPTDRLGDGWAAGCTAALTMALGNPNVGRLGICIAPDCDRVYVDRSKNGTRNFCGIHCQNRVKTSATANTDHKDAN